MLGELSGFLSVQRGVLQTRQLSVVWGLGVLMNEPGEGSGSVTSCFGTLCGYVHPPTHPPPKP